MIQLLFVAANILCNNLSISVPITLEVSYEGKVLNYLTPGQYYTYSVDSPDDLDITPLLSLPKSVSKCNMVQEPQSILITYDSIIPEWVQRREFLEDYQKYVGPGQAMIAAEFTSDDPTSERYDFNDIIIMFQNVNHVPLPKPETELSLQ